MAKKTRRRKGQKVKSSSPVKREFSAGGAVHGGGKWLIIKPAGTDRWQFPKGKIDKGESSKEAAVREVEEEGGIRVKPMKKVGDTQYFFTLKGQKIFKKVTFYLMEYVGDGNNNPDEIEVDEARFVPFGEALSLLTFEDDKKILKKAKKLASKKN